MVGGEYSTSGIGTQQALFKDSLGYSVSSLYLSNLQLTGNAFQLFRRVFDKYDRDGTDCLDQALGARSTAHHFTHSSVLSALRGSSNICWLKVPGTPGDTKCKQVSRGSESECKQRKP